MGSLRTLLQFLAVVLLVGGCTYDPTYRGIKCTQERVCPEGFVCVGFGEDAHCVHQDQTDAGEDAGEDAGLPDGTANDAEDAGQDPGFDAGGPDEMIDAGDPDEPYDAGDPGPGDPDMSADDGQAIDEGPDCDMDDDGHPGPQCAGDDCDDLDRFVYPGAPEGPYGSPTCTDFKDNDCDQMIDHRDPGCFRNWWDASFACRRRIVFLNSGQEEDLESFPVLVKLDPSLVNYSLTHQQGWDLRFVDDNGATVLAHEIESWAQGGESIVWVNVTSIEGASDDDYMWMYYANQQAPNIQNPDGVWSAGYQAVYHLDGLSDSSPSGFDASDHGTQESEGRIGRGRLFGSDPANQYIDMGSDLPLLMGVDGWTLSAWIRADRISSDEDYVISISVHSSYPTDNSRATLGLAGYDEARAGGRAGDGDSFHTVTSSGNTIATDRWHWLAGVARYGRWSEGRLRIYVDGQLARSTSVSFDQDNASNTTASYNAIGSQDDASDDFFIGTIDEVRVSPVIRSADWIAAQYLSMTGQFLEFLEEEYY